jgi:hypothetical protein
MKLTLLLTSISATAAFTSRAAAPKTTTSSLSAGMMDDMAGSVDFQGKPFKFDPLNLSETYAPLVPFFREAELRHARTAMLAVTGWIVADVVRIPGDMYSFAHVASSKDAHDIMIADGPLVQLLLWIGLWDIVVTGPAISATMQGEREPGDFGWTKYAPKDEAGMKKAVQQELLNGRLAMMAMGGIATQSVLTGHGFPYI